MAFKCYFDGSGKADTGGSCPELTLAVVSGTSAHWSSFEESWGHVLRTYGFEYLHATDAVAAKGIFRNAGREKITRFLADCVTVLERCCSIRSGRKIVYAGLRPATVTVSLSGYRQAFSKIDDLVPVEEFCVVQAIHASLRYCKALESYRCLCFFDQNEPFCGHVLDRVRSKRAIGSGPDWSRVSVSTSRASETPALQCADIFAWAVSRRAKLAGEWHERLLKIDRDGDYFDRDGLLSRIDPSALKCISALNLPKRRSAKRDS